MSGYPRDNTIQAAIASAAASAITLKLPNAGTGALPGGQSGGAKPIGATQRWRVKCIVVSFTATPAAAATLVITDGVVTMTFDLLTSGPFVLNPVDFQFAGGAEVDFTLASGGGTAVGHINVSAVSEG